MSLEPTYSPPSALVAPVDRTPQTRAGRLDAVDALRGLALFGVIVMNLHSMSGLEFMSHEQLIKIQDRLDQGVRTALQVLVDKKSLSAFSFLFGLSFFLVLGKARSYDLSFLAQYARRLLGLAALGLLNVAFLYWGDILITYAVLGSLLPIAVLLPQRWLLALSATMLIGLPALFAALGVTRAPDVQTVSDLLALQTFGSGSYTAVVAHGFYRYFALAERHSLLSDWNYLNIFGLFLLGLWVGRRGIAQDLPRFRKRLIIVAAVAVPIGLAAAVCLTLLPRTSPLSTLALVSRPILAIGYLAAAALLLDSPAGRPIRTALAPLGRMALTSYLSAGLVGQIVFYGWALGWSGRIGTTEVVAVGVLTYTVLVILSQLWLSRFRMGPVEWVWRCFTKFSPQPIRDSH